MTSYRVWHRGTTTSRVSCFFKRLWLGRHASYACERIEALKKWNLHCMSPLKSSHTSKNISKIILYSISANRSVSPKSTFHSTYIQHSHFLWQMFTELGPYFLRGLSLSQNVWRFSGVQCVSKYCWLAFSFLCLFPLQTAPPPPPPISPHLICASTIFAGSMSLLMSAAGFMGHSTNS